MPRRSPEELGLREIGGGVAVEDQPEGLDLEAPKRRSPEELGLRELQLTPQGLPTLEAPARIPRMMPSHAPTVTPRTTPQATPQPGIDLLPSHQAINLPRTTPQITPQEPQVAPVAPRPINPKGPLHGKVLPLSVEAPPQPAPREGQRADISQRFNAPIASIPQGLISPEKAPYGTTPEEQAPPQQEMKTEGTPDSFNPADMYLNRDVIAQRLLVDNPAKAIQWANEPLADFKTLVNFTLPKFTPQDHPIVYGALDALSRFTTPQNIALMVATGGLTKLVSGTVGKLISLGFGADTIANILDQSEPMQDAADVGDWDKVNSILGEMLVSGALAQSLIRHGTGARGIGPQLKTPGMPSLGKMAGMPQQPGQPFPDWYLRYQDMRRATMRGAENLAGTLRGSKTGEILPVEPEAPQARQQLTEGEPIVNVEQEPVRPKPFTPAPEPKVEAPIPAPNVPRETFETPLEKTWLPEPGRLAPSERMLPAAEPYVEKIIKEKEAAEEQRDQARREAEVDPRTGQGSAIAFKRALPKAEADPNTEIGSLDLANLKARNDLESPAGGDREIEAAADSLVQAAVELGVSPRVFTPKGDELYIFGPKGKIQPLVDRAVEIYGRRQIEDSSYENYIRGGVGPTQAEADAAMSTLKAGEKGEKYRKLETQKPAPPKHELLSDATEWISAENSTRQAPKTADEAWKKFSGQNTRDEPMVDEKTFKDAWEQMSQARAKVGEEPKVEEPVSGGGAPWQIGQEGDEIFVKGPGGRVSRYGWAGVYKSGGQWKAEVFDDQGKHVAFAAQTDSRAAAEKGARAWMQGHIDRAFKGKGPAAETAKKLRESADALQKHIDEKRNPATAGQNPTARRANIMAGMAQEAANMEELQTRLRQLADAHEAGTLPKALGKITTKTQLENILRYRKYPSVTFHFSDWKEITDNIRYSQDKKLKKERDLFNPGFDRDSNIARPTYDDLKHLAYVVQQVGKMGKSGSRVARSIQEDITKAEGLAKAGIYGDIDFQEAKKALDELGMAKKEAPLAQKIREKERDLIGRKIEGYFPTPKALTEQILPELDVQPGDLVLEPSAGKGNMADVLREQHPEAKIHVIEPNSTLREILDLKGYTAKGNDFLKYEPTMADQPNKILMNPPFEMGQDMSHLRHAYKILKPGGRVVAIVSEGPFFREDSKAREFRDWLEQVEAKTEKNPEKSFTGAGAERQTGVATRTVVIDKPKPFEKPAALEHYAWNRNAEGGQLAGNIESIYPLDRSMYEKYLQEGIRGQMSFDAYHKEFPEVTHISIVARADGKEIVGRTGSLSETRPRIGKAQWWKKVSSPESPEAKEWTGKSDLAPGEQEAKNWVSQPRQHLEQKLKLATPEDLPVLRRASEIARAEKLDMKGTWIDRRIAELESAPVEPKVVVPAKKADWQMTRQEFRTALGLDPDKRHVAADAAQAVAIADALAEGKPVPPEVLAQFPDINRPTEPVVAKPEAPKAPAWPEHIQKKFDEARRRLEKQAEELPAQKTKALKRTDWEWTQSPQSLEDASRIIFIPGELYGPDTLHMGPLAMNFFAHTREGELGKGRTRPGVRYTGIAIPADVRQLGAWKNAEGSRDDINAYVSQIVSDWPKQGGNLKPWGGSVYTKLAATKKYLRRISKELKTHFGHNTNKTIVLVDLGRGVEEMEQTELHERAHIRHLNVLIAGGKTAWTDLVDHYIFLNDPLVQQAVDYAGLDRNYSPVMQPTEVAARISSGELMSLSIEDGTDVFARFFDMLLEKHGDRAYTILGDITPILEDPIYEKVEPKIARYERWHTKTQPAPKAVQGLPKGREEPLVLNPEEPLGPIYQKRAEGDESDREVVAILADPGLALYEHGVTDPAKWLKAMRSEFPLDQYPTVNDPTLKDTFQQIIAAKGKAEPKVEAPDRTQVEAQALEKLRRTGVAHIGPRSAKITHEGDYWGFEGLVKGRIDETRSSKSREIYKSHLDAVQEAYRWLLQTPAGTPQGPKAPEKWITERPEFQATKLIENLIDDPGTAAIARSEVEKVDARLQQISNVMMTPPTYSGGQPHRDTRPNTVAKMINRDPYLDDLREQEKAIRDKGQAESDKFMGALPMEHFTNLNLPYEAVIQWAKKIDQKVILEWDSNKKRAEEIVKRKNQEISRTRRNAHLKLKPLRQDLNEALGIIAKMEKKVLEFEREAITFFRREGDKLMFVKPTESSLPPELAKQLEKIWEPWNAKRNVITKARGILDSYWDDTIRALEDEEALLKSAKSKLEERATELYDTENPPTLKLPPEPGGAKPSNNQLAKLIEAFEKNAIRSVEDKDNPGTYKETGEIMVVGRGGAKDLLARGYAIEVSADGWPVLTDLGKKWAAYGTEARKALADGVAWANRDPRPREAIGTYKEMAEQSAGRYAGWTKTKDGKSWLTNGHWAIESNPPKAPTGKLSIEEIQGDKKGPTIDAVIPKDANTKMTPVLVTSGYDQDKGFLGDLVYFKVEFGKEPFSVSFNRDYIEGIVNRFPKGEWFTNAIKAEHHGPGVYKVNGDIVALVMPMGGTAKPRGLAFASKGVQQPNRPAPGGKGMADIGGYAVRDQHQGNIFVQREPARRAPSGYEGYTPTGGEPPPPGKSYPTSARSIVQLPEIIQLIRNINENKIPSIKKFLTGALGRFMHDFAGTRGDIDIRADIFLGELLDVKKTAWGSEWSAYQNDMRLAFSAFFDLDRIVFKREWRKGFWYFKTYHKDPTLAPKVIAHELGHLVDWLGDPRNTELDRTMKRGNILGRIATLKSYLFESLPGSPLGDQPLTAEEKEGIRQEAARLMRQVTEQEIDEVIRTETNYTPDDILEIFKGVAASSSFDPKLYEYIGRLDRAQKKLLVVEALKGRLAETRPPTPKKIVETATGRKIKSTVEATPEQIAEKYVELIKEAMKGRQLIERKVVTEELKRVTHIWKPFIPQRGDSFTKYRYSSKELYADAISVLMNEPELLRREAPTFYQGLFTYMDRKPDVKDMYDAIQQKIGNNDDTMNDRLSDIEAMFKRGYGIREDLTERQKAPEKIRDTGAKFFIDRMHGPLKGIKQLETVPGDVGAKAREARYLLEEIFHLADSTENYIYHIAEKVLQPAKDAGITAEQVGAYLFLRRAAFERNEIANPLGQTEIDSKATLEGLKKQLGEAKWKELETIGDDWRKVRQQYIIPELVQGRYYSPEINDLFLNNPHYVRFNVLHHLEKAFGTGVTAKIHKQFGTLSEIENPLVATVLQDIAMMRAVAINNAKRALIRDALLPLGEAKKPEMYFNAYSYRMEPKQPRDPHRDLMPVMENGRLEFWDVSREIAKSFETDPYQAKMLGRIWGLMTNPVRSLLVSHNPVWMARNVVRDIRATYKNIPEIPIYGDPKLLKIYKESFAEAWRDTMTAPKWLPEKMQWEHERSQTISDMRQKRMLIPGRVYEGSFTKANENFENELERLAHHFEIHLGEDAEKAGGAFQALKDAFDRLGRIGQVTELTGKIAGYKYLKSQLREVTDPETGETRLLPTRGEKEIGHMVRTRVSTPDIKRTGEGQAITNGLILFSNVNKEGWRSSYESFRDDPSGYAWKTLASNMIPKLIMWGIGLGFAGAYARRMVQNVSEYDKGLYTVVPLGINRDGKTAYFRIPEDYEGQFFGALFYLMLKGKVTDAGGMINQTGEQVPWNLSKANPWLKLAWDLYTYYGVGVNPTGSWGRQTIMPDRVFQAGGVEASKALFWAEWKNLGGSTLYNPSGNRLKVDEGIWERISKYTPFNVLGTFLKISDQGVADRLDEISKQSRKETAGRQLAVQKRITESIRAAKGKPTRADMRTLFLALRRDNLLTPATSEKEFEGRYFSWATRAGGNPYMERIINATTNEEKDKLLKEYRKMLTPQEYDDIINRLATSRAEPKVREAERKSRREPQVQPMR